MEDMEASSALPLTSATAAWGSLDLTDAWEDASDDVLAESASASASASRLPRTIDPTCCCDRASHGCSALVRHDVGAGAGT